MSLLQAPCHDAVLMISAWKAVNSPFVTVLATALFGGLAVDYLLRMRERVALERRDAFETRRQLQLNISHAVHAHLAAAHRRMSLREVVRRSEGITSVVRWVPIRWAPPRRNLMLLHQQDQAAALAWDEEVKDWSIRRQEIAVRLRLRFRRTKLPDRWETLANHVSSVPVLWSEAVRAGESPCYRRDLTQTTGQAIEFLTDVMQEPLSPVVGKRPGRLLGLG